MTPDSSVVVAAFASWHERHADALEALTGAERLIAHVGLETYSVLTRLPAPHRAPPELVATWLGRRFRGRWLGLSPPTAQRLPGRLAALAISGGATYDGLIAATALEHELALMTFDVRAERTYAQVGVSLAQPWSS